jgi:CubicO group peptidase (beta-lactamase class C family)
MKPIFAIPPLVALVASALFSMPLSANAAAEEQGFLKPELARSKACREWRHFAIDFRKTDGGLKTDQIVVKNKAGETLFQWADAPYKISTRHQLWSTSKTISATIMATAIQQGKVKLTDRLAKYLPESARSNHRFASLYNQVTIENLITMTSGIEWSEHSNDEVKDASDLAMMYSEGYKNFTRYIMGLDFNAKPGEYWNYSSVNADLMMAILKKVYKSDYDQMPWKNLFDPLGIKSAVFEQDSAGVFLGGSYVYLSAEDMAKFGVLFLNDGMADGKRVLPEGWVERAKQLVPQIHARMKSRDDLRDYGSFSKGGWWINTPIPKIGKPYLRSPESLMTTTGFLGQWISVLPEQEIVVARTGHERDSEWTLLDPFIAGAVACFSKK